MGTRWLAVALLVGACAEPVGKEGALVGIQTLELRDAARGRDVTTEMWFEPVPSAQGASFSVLPPIRPLFVAQDAAPEDVGPRPLVVLSHGNWGLRYSLGWLAQSLVREGYLVASPTHPGTTREDRSLEGSFRLWERSLDVS
ncbi:MAG: hypothetical protein AAF602_24105, partial [Myxococcota bacterium]